MDAGWVKMTAVRDYQLGHQAAELDRLTRQGAALAPATRAILEATGIGAGMRVLDLGSGMGDMAFLAAELVGASGEVVGIELAPEAVAKATARAREAGLDQVRFLAGDIQHVAPDGPYDAVIGRLVLMYVPDPAAVLRTQAGLLRPGGLVVPVEFDLFTARAIPPTPLVGTCLSWLGEAFRRSGVDSALGPRLWEILRGAGLRPVAMLGVQPHFGPDDPDASFILAGIVRSALPLIERSGVATASDVGVEGLEERIATDLQAAGAVFAHPTLIGTWARKD